MGRQDRFGRQDGIRLTMEDTQTQRASSSSSPCTAADTVRDPLRGSGNHTRKSDCVWEGVCFEVGDSPDVDALG